MSVSVLEDALEARRPGCRHPAPVDRRTRLELVRPHDSKGRPLVVDLRPPAASAAERLRDALQEVGLEGEALESFARSAEVVGALTRGTSLADGADSDDASDEETPGKAGDVAAQTAAASRVLDGIGALTDVSTRIDAAVLAAARELTARHGRILLQRRGVTDPGQLTQGQREKWRARAKSVTRHEIEALTGWGAGEVVDLIGLANAPRAVVDVVASGLRAGVTPWRLARRFWRECSVFAHEDAAHVASTLFGADPHTVAPERLTPEGEVSQGPWRHREFYAALEREVTKINGRDPAAARAKRLRALAARDVTATIDQDGTGCLAVRGSAVQIAAALDRIDRAARRARKLGDQRSLANLRADIALSLLLHSGLALPDLPEDAEQITVEHTEALAKVLNAMPSALLEVIVPFSALHVPSAGQLPVDPARLAGDSGSGVPPPGDRLHPSSDRLHPSSEEVEVLTAGQLKGAFSRYVSADQLRDLALVPGSTMYRLVTDPLTGRCLERSTTAYRPDAAMRAQIQAADVTCRGPGCLRHGSSLQYDHVDEFGDGGSTAETNLQLLDTALHDLKTVRLWDCVLEENRDVTWTTLLGRIYRTRAHDYRQYVTLLTESVAGVRVGSDYDLTGAINRALYAALSHRAPGEPLQSEDDDVDVDLRFGGWDLVHLTHTTKEGRTRYGAPSDVVRDERVREDRAAGTAHPTPQLDKEAAAGTTPPPVRHDDLPPF